MLGVDVSDIVVFNDSADIVGTEYGLLCDEMRTTAGYYVFKLVVHVIKKFVATAPGGVIDLFG